MLRMLVVKRNCKMANCAIFYQFKKNFSTQQKLSVEQKRRIGVGREKDYHFYTWVLDADVACPYEDIVMWLTHCVMQNLGDREQRTIFDLWQFPLTKKHWLDSDFETWKDLKQFEMRGRIFLSKILPTFEVWGFCTSIKAVLLKCIIINNKIWGFFIQIFEEVGNDDKHKGHGFGAKPTGMINSILITRSWTYMCCYHIDVKDLSVDFNVSFSYWVLLVRWALPAVDHNCSRPRHNSYE